MPIYEYGCPDCGNRFEEWQKMSDPPVTVCPKCEQENVTKLISAPAFHLKGGGWYSDHYGLKAGGSEESTTAAAKSDSAPSDSAPSADSTSAPASTSSNSPSTPAAPASKPSSD